MAELTPVLQVKESILQLQEQLLTAHPQMPILLHRIHTQLRADPALTTLLSEEDIGILVSGLKKQTLTEIATTISKSKTKSIKQIGLGDL